MSKVIKLDAKHAFEYDRNSHLVYHANKGEGLPQHVHEFSHATICHSGSCIVRKENFEREITNDLQRTYGISYEDKLAMIKQQNFKCAICKSEISYDNKAAVDHCHTSMKVRGILCRACNTGIGHLQDSVEVLEIAIQYLKKHLL